MILTGITLFLVGFILGIWKLGSQLFDLLKWDFSRLSHNLLWVVIALGLLLIGTVCLVVGLVGLIL